MRQPFGARVGCLPCRGCGHIVSAPSVPPYGVHRRAYASGPLAAALREEECGAPLRDGRPCSVLPRLHSLESTAPASAASFTARQADDRKIRLPQPGTDLATRQTLSCCVPLSGKAARSMEQVSGAGIISDSDPQRVGRQSPVQLHGTRDRHAHLQSRRLGWRPNLDVGGSSGIGPEGREFSQVDRHQWR